MSEMSEKSEKSEKSENVVLFLFRDLKTDGKSDSPAQRNLANRALFFSIINVSNLPGLDDFFTFMPRHQCSVLVIVIFPIFF